jgi:hypothetical protein
MVGVLRGADGGFGAAAGRACGAGFGVGAVTIFDMAVMRTPDQVQGLGWVTSGTRIGAVATPQEIV